MQDDNKDAAAYEMFVRRTFNCDRGDTRFPFADSNAWVTLIDKWNFATDPTRSKNSLGQRTKDFEKYFKTMLEYFDKTFDFALRKHAGKEGREQMFESLNRLKSEAANASGVADLRVILGKAVAVLDEFNIVLK
jgi:hypothetical protein